MVPEEQKDVLKYNEHAKMPKQKPFAFKLGEFNFEDFDNSHESAEYIKQQVAIQVENCFHRTYTEIWEGDMQKIANLPVESFIPLLFISHLSRFAQEVSMNPKNIDMGFDPE